MPVTGQDAVRNGPAMERKAKMGASIVDRVAARSLANHQERATVALDDRHPPCFQLVEVTDAYPGACSASFGSSHDTSLLRALHPIQYEHKLLLLPGLVAGKAAIDVVVVVDGLIRVEGLEFPLPVAASRADLGAPVGARFSITT